jgi:putative tryptophan/tyrosine transport system substrate-binding protein
MRRRELIALLGGATAAWPLVGRAQQSDQLRRVAVLGDTPSVWSVWIVAFADRLHELGWIEGRTMAIDIAGRKDDPSALQKSLPSSYGGSLM